MRLTLLPFLFAVTLFAEPLSPGLHRDTLEALWQAEGSHRARWPYGLKSARITCPVRGREVAGRLIHGYWRDWLAAGRPGPWPHYVADRHCPPAGDRTGNRRLRRNLEMLLRAAHRRAATKP